MATARVFVFRRRQERPKEIMGRIALFLPKYFELWIIDPVKASLLTLATIITPLLLKGIFWLLLDYKYWKMGKELNKRYDNTI